MKNKIIKLLQQNGFRLLGDDEVFFDQTDTIEVVGNNLIYTPNCTIEFSKKLITVNESTVRLDDLISEVLSKENIVKH